MTKIKVIIETKTENEVELELPYYCRTNFNFYKILDENKCLLVSTPGREGINAMGTFGIYTSYTSVALKGSEQCTEADFIKAYDEVAALLLEVRSKQ